MNQDIIAKGFRSGSARMLAARHIAREAGVPFRQALSMVDRPPVTLRKNVPLQDVASCLGAYRKVGIDAEAVGVSAPEREQTPEAALPPAAASNPIRGAWTVPLSPSLIVAVPGSGAEPVGKSEENPSRRRVFSEGLRSWLVAAALIAFVCCGIALLARSGHPLSTRLRHLAGGGIADSADAKTDFLVAGVARKCPRSAEKEGESAAYRLRAREYVDSAELYREDIESAIRFYTMAIAFNKHNMKAWHGLIDAYRAAGRTADEERTREEMRRLFGESVFSIETIFRPFGPLVEFRRTGDGGISVEYRSSAPAKRTALLKEVYCLAKALRTMCDCQKMTIFAAKGPSSGLIVHCGTREYFESVERFEAVSRVYFFESPGN